jgi:hypothetical protein
VDGGALCFDRLFELRRDELTERCMQRLLLCTCGVADATGRVTTEVFASRGVRSMGNSKPAVERDAVGVDVSSWLPISESPTDGAIPVPYSVYRRERTPTLRNKNPMELPSHLIANHFDVPSERQTSTAAGVCSKRWRYCRSHGPSDFALARLVELPLRCVSYGRLWQEQGGFGQPRPTASCDAIAFVVLLRFPVDPACSTRPRYNHASARDTVVVDSTGVLTIIGILVS